MKKQILNIGKALNKKEQKKIFGGHDFTHVGDDNGFACKIGEHACKEDSECPGSCTCIEDVIHGSTCS